ncbi:hypothetical protein AAL_03000 [Moelleriella libera RCEF 2490]|uniref:Uncharacterized protein n=1 Tax=Moelleriella libera RCEF 2490 TaxID=1081109 RepID=A0A162IU99_9HYPO|nr:hypothetical protein AAL_03000 [Moelleriella libera RCEF 2490]
MTARPPTPPRGSTTRNSANSNQEVIPPLTTITPAIFVPIPASFFSTMTSPRQSAEAIKDAQAASVKANICTLTQRECVRIRCLAGPTRREATEKDLRGTLANMESKELDRRRRK